MTQTTEADWYEGAEWRRKPQRVVPYDRYRAVVDRATDAIELLNAIALFSGPGVVNTVRSLDDLINKINQRLGQLEKRLDEAKIPEAEIPDDECLRYFTLPMLGQVT